MSALQTFSPLSLNQLTRDLWGRYDGSIIAQLAALADDPCYMMKFYKAPSDEQEVMPANGYAAYGMEITPGSIIFGFYLRTFGPAFAPFNVQITDVSLGHKLFDAPTAALFLSNIKVTYQASLPVQLGSFPNLLCAPYPVVGSGLFMVEIQESSGFQQRIELVFGVLEVCG